MRKWLTGLLMVSASCAALLAGASFGHPGATRAGASVPSAVEMADRALTTVIGPDDEGNYSLIDPIGPGGVKSVEAADEVFASTLQGGKYRPWAPYRDPFAPPPVGPPSPRPYPPGGGSYGGGTR